MKCKLVINEITQGGKDGGSGKKEDGGNQLKCFLLRGSKDISRFDDWGSFTLKTIWREATEENNNNTNLIGFINETINNFETNLVGAHSIVEDNSDQKQ